MFLESKVRGGSNIGSTPVVVVDVGKEEDGNSMPEVDKTAAPAPAPAPAVVAVVAVVAVGSGVIVVEVERRAEGNRVVASALEELDML